VKICKTICLARPTAELATNICKKLVGRINDEESIRNLVLGTFKELWFEESKNQNDILNAAALTEKPVFTLQQRAHQILDVIEASDGHYSWFEELVQGVSALGARGDFMI
jgi:cohesin loading factor subunit SCC2